MAEPVFRRFWYPVFPLDMLRAGPQRFELPDQTLERSLSMPAAIRPRSDGSAWRSPTMRSTTPTNGVLIAPGSRFCLIEDRGDGVDVDKIVAFDRRVTLEDKRILAGTDPDVPLDMRSEQHMPSDRPGLAMRRILKRLIDRENSRASR